MKIEIKYNKIKIKEEEYSAPILRAEQVEESFTIKMLVLHIKQEVKFVDYKFKDCERPTLEYEMRERNLRSLWNGLSLDYKHKIEKYLSQKEIDFLFNLLE